MEPLNLRESYCVRGKDCHGFGHFGAPRGRRRHNGIDVVAEAGQEVLSCSDGTISKIGYPYADDLSYRYVEVQRGPYRERYFYVQPAERIELGLRVKAGDSLGTIQDLCCRYGGIGNHCHLEIKDSRGGFIDPNKYLESLR